MMNVTKYEDLEGALFNLINNLYSNNPADKHIVYDGTSALTVSAVTELNPSRDNYTFY